MATTELSKETVIAALDYFKQQGNPNPGQLRLLDYIRSQGGKGSIPRLKNLLRIIKEEKEIALAELDREPLPDPIADFASKLWGEMTTLLETREHVLKEESEKAIQLAQDKLEESQFKLSEFEQQMQKLALDKEELEKKLAKSESNAQLLSQSNELLKLESNNAIEKISSLDKRLGDLKSMLAKESKEAASREHQLNQQIDFERNRYTELANTSKAELERVRGEHTEKLSEQRETIIAQETVFNKSSQDFNRQLKDRESKLKKATNSLSEMDIKLKKQDNLLSEAKNKISQIENTLSVKEAENISLLSQIDILTKQVEDGIAARKELTKALKKK